MKSNAAAVAMTKSAPPTAKKKAVANLSGLEKTAILMNVLGKERSFTMMKDLKDTDVRRLLKVMGEMRKAPIALINTVLREYLYKIAEREDIIFDEKLSEPSVIKEGLGEERAKAIFGSLKAVNLIDQKHLTVLESVEPKVIAEFLVEEHPQTIALVMAHMELTKQIATLRNFPDSIRTEVVLRMASLEYVAPEKVDELDDMLKKELAMSGKARTNKFGGVVAVAELVNNLDKKTMNSLMTRLEDKDPILAEQIRQHMLTFADIGKIDDRGVQLILREVPNDRLLLALKSAAEEVREKIFAAMSTRASDMLREDLAALGPTKVSDVESAQRQIASVMKRLQDEGKIVIGFSEEQEVIP
jgi:flagellar motor switch protein FliG